MDFPADASPAPSVLTPFHPDSLGSAGSTYTGTLNQTSSTAWPTNNLAYYYPFRLYSHAVAVQLLFMVGATSSGNVDVGIYNSSLKLIVSAGSTAMSVTVNTVQEFNITDTPLPPGDYLLGVAVSTTGATGFRGLSISDENMGLIPIYEQASALPLPDPAVPVLMTAAAGGIWICGIQFGPTF